MTNVRKAMSRTSPKTGSLGPRDGGGSTAPSRLTVDDVCHALAFIDSPVGELLMRAKWGSVTDADLKALRGHVRQHVAWLAMREQWAMRDPSLVDRMAELVIAEEIEAATCPRCHGTGYTYGEAVRVCDRCNGTGRVYRGQRASADALGVSRAAYRETWEHRHANLRAWLQEIEAAAARAMNRALADEEDA